MNTHITVTNGKAFHEGVEIERDSFFIAFYGKHPVHDGTYPLPEGWEVVKEYWYSAYETGWGTVSKDIYNYFITKTPNYCRVTARLVRKEQSAHSSQSKEELRKELKFCIGKIFMDKFLEYNEGKFHTALEMNPPIHAVTEYVESKLSQKEQEIDRLKKEREPISELLAILHRDGGHYQEKHGLEKAIKDAIELIHTEWVNKDEVDRLKKELEELKK